MPALSDRLLGGRPCAETLLPRCRRRRLLPGRGHEKTQWDDGAVGLNTRDPWRLSIEKEWNRSLRSRNSLPSGRHLCAERAGLPRARRFRLRQIEGFEHQSSSGLYAPFESNPTGGLFEDLIIPVIPWTFAPIEKNPAKILGIDRGDQGEMATPSVKPPFTPLKLQEKPQWPTISRKSV